MSEKPAAERATEASIEIDAPIEAVWKALNDAEELTRWFPLQAGVNPDGSVWMAWGDDFRFEGKPEVLDAPRYMRTSMLTMLTEVFLEARAGRTHLRLVQSGFGAGAEWDSELDATHRGWEFQLRGLKLYLERHRGTPRRVVWARRMHSLERPEAWRGLLGAEGLLGEGSLDGVRPGDPFRFRTADGDLFEGEATHHAPPLDFAGIVASWNDAYLRIWADDLPLRGYRDVNLWLSTYGLTPAEVEGLEKRWAALLARLFPG
jgi:uncharacterized protein YndB with AHSA1/START domain